MAKYKLKAQAPLGGTEPKVEEFEAITIAENIDCALASIAQRHGKEKGFNAAAKRMFRAPLPGPGQLVSKGDYTVFWTGPEQWFVEAPAGSHEDIVGILKPAFKENGSITEQSGGWARFDLTGPNCVPILERLCAVDTAKMSKDSATRTVIEHIGAFLLCREEAAQFTVYGPRSSAHSLHHALVAATQSAA